MKILLIVLLLCASLTANVLLLVRTSRSHSADGAPRPLDRLAHFAISPSTKSSTPALSKELIAQLKDSDPGALQKLREIGFSEKVIRTLAEAQIDAKFHERELALLKRSVGPYWKPGYRAFNPANYSAEIDLQREKEAALKTLLGEHYVSEPSRYDLRFAHLPPEKAVRVRQIEEDYTAMTAAGNNFAEYGVFIRFPEDQQKQVYLSQQKRTELSQLLTPDELFEYNLRTSAVAANLRFQLAAFQPTEEEFRNIFTLRQAAESKQGLSDSDYSPDAFAARRKLEGELDQQVKQLLGENRFAEFKRSSEPDYRRFYQIATQLGLPRETVNEAQTLKTSIEEQQKMIARDPAASDRAVRAERLEALARDAEAGLRRILGDTGFETYRQAPGNFLQRLKPPASRTTKG